MWRPLLDGGRHGVGACPAPSLRLVQVAGGPPLKVEFGRVEGHFQQLYFLQKSSRVPAAPLWTQGWSWPWGYNVPLPTSPKLCPSHSSPLLSHPVSPAVFTAGALRNLGPALVRGGGDRSSALEWLPPTVARAPGTLGSSGPLPWPLGTAPKRPEFPAASPVPSSPALFRQVPESAAFLPENTAPDPTPSSASRVNAS